MAAVRSDPEVPVVMQRYHTTLRTILERHGGTVEEFVGDAALAEPATAEAIESPA